LLNAISSIHHSHITPFAFSLLYQIADFIESTEFVNGTTLVLLTKAEKKADA
jgi:hypothetical protein